MQTGSKMNSGPRHTARSHVVFDVASSFLNLSNQNLRRPRIFRDREDMLDTLNDADFFQRYRMARSMFYEILAQVWDDIQHNTQRNHAFTAAQQLLIELRFLASGSFQQVIADTMKVNNWIRVQYLEQLQELPRPYTQFIYLLAVRTRVCANCFYRIPLIPFSLCGRRSDDHDGRCDKMAGIS